MSCSISVNREIKEDESLCKIVRAEIREANEREEEERKRRYERRYINDEI